MTGAAGWLGSRLVRRLVTGAGDQPLQVYAMVRPGGNRTRLDGLFGRIEVVEADLLDEAGLTRQLDVIRPDVCFHFAWYAVPGLYWRSPENLDSLRGSLSLALGLASLGCRRFVGVGTSAEYLPSGTPLSETSATGGNSLYAASKLAFQLLLAQVADAKRMRWLWARVFYQYGPQEDGRRLVPSVIRALLEGQPALLTPGEQARDFLHVDDVAGAIAAAAASELDGIVNIGSGQAVTVAEIARTIGALMHRPDLIRLGARPADPSDPPYVCADVTRLMSTGWRPTYNLQAGLVDTIEWFRGQPAHAGRTARRQDA